MKFSIVFILAAVCIANGAWAEDASDTTKMDQHVLSKMHHGNQMEIEMSKLVAARATTNGIKEYAEHIIQDHGKADIEVKMTAKKEGVELKAPTPMNDEEKQAMKDDHAEMTKLKSLKGAEFETEYENAMAAGHQKTITELNGVLPKVGTDTHALIEKLLPEFQKHLDMINKLKMA
jgi:putative membrane protein